LGAGGIVLEAARGEGYLRVAGAPRCAILTGVSDVSEVVVVLGAIFPTEDAVAAMESGELGDRLAALEEVAWPDFEVAMVGASPSVRIETQGVDGLLEAWRDWLSPFDTHRTEIEEVQDADDRALILIRQFARPHGASGEVENAGAAVLWTRDGKLSRIEFHLNRDEARRAGGFAAAG
jgi:ketosteroid isomerase-like protein